MRALQTLFVFLLCQSVFATTLVNITLDEAFERADVVALFWIVEATVLEVEESNVAAGTPDNCGINVRARIMESFKNTDTKEIEFTTLENVKVGTPYLGFLDLHDSVKWHIGNWHTYMYLEEDVNPEQPPRMDQILSSTDLPPEDLLVPGEFVCLENTRKLKASAFPQRLMELDDEGWLLISLNSVFFGAEVEVASGHDLSYTMQYNDMFIKYDDVREKLSALSMGKVEKEQ